MQREEKLNEANVYYTMQNNKLREREALSFADHEKKEAGI